MLLELLLLASGLTATTYGHGEFRCGSIGNPVQCVRGAITASGMVFDPGVPMAAIPAPTNMRFRDPMRIGLRIPHGPCVMVWVADKSHPRWIGSRGFDLTPAAVTKLTGKRATHYWSGEVEICNLAPLEA